MYYYIIINDTVFYNLINSFCLFVMYALSYSGLIFQKILSKHNTM